MFCVQCCYVVGVCRSDGLMIDMVYDIVGGEYVWDVGLGCIVVDIGLYFDVVVFQFQLVFKDGGVWVVVDGDK